MTADLPESFPGIVLTVALTRQSNRRDCLIGLTRYASTPILFNSAALIASSEELENVNRGIMREPGRLAAMYSPEQWPAFGVY